MKPHDPQGPFAATVNWKHFWYCMHNPQTHPHMQPKQPEGWQYFAARVTLPALSSNVINITRKRA